MFIAPTSFTYHTRVTQEPMVVVSEVLSAAGGQLLAALVAAIVNLLRVRLIGSNVHNIICPRNSKHPACRYDTYPSTSV